MLQPKSNGTQQPGVVELQVTDDLTVQIIPHAEHQYLMSMRAVADGYGIPTNTLNRQKLDHSEELVEGTHYLKGMSFSHTLDMKGLQPHAIYWTKAGVVRLGFFIKSGRAKVFRDWAEGVILQSLSAPKLPALPAGPKPRHNRLDQNRMVSILADIAQIRNHALRERLAAKLMGDYDYTTEQQKGGHNG